MNKEIHDDWFLSTETLHRDLPGGSGGGMSFPFGWVVREGARDGWFGL